MISLFLPVVFGRATISDLSESTCDIYVFGRSQIFKLCMNNLEAFVSASPLERIPRCLIYWNYFCIWRPYKHRDGTTGLNPRRKYQRAGVIRHILQAPDE